MYRAPLYVVLIIAFSLVACSGDQGSTPGNNASNNVNNQNNADLDMASDLAVDPGPPTYHRDIRPLVEANCVKCHDPGGLGPFELHDYEKVKLHATLMMSSIESGSMPPWPADNDCRTYKDARFLGDDERAIFQTWIDNEMLEGDPADYVAPLSDKADRGPANIVSTPSGAFTPTVASGDEYRCFLLDADFAEDTWVTGVDVEPGNRALVHHANMFLLNPTNAGRAQELEDADDIPGYPCFGDAGVSTINLIGSWVPGLDPIKLPEGSAVRVRAGSKIVMQTHFNNIYAENEPVLSEFHLWTRDTPPEFVVRAMPFANLNFEVAAGDPDSEHVEEFTNLSDKTWTILGSAAHLHLLASRVKVEIIRRNSNAEECVLDIPKWDFDWQLAYFFPDDDWMYVEPGDKVRLTCAYDNSPANQPEVDGQKITPQDLSWGGGTFDEMCLNFLVVAEPYDAESLSTGELCEQFSTCRDTCDDPFGIGCIFNCGAEEFDCGECLLTGAQRCANRFCRDELRAALPCLYNCAQGAQAGGDIDACLVLECPAERDALNTCMRPRVEGGFCNNDLESCNVEF